MRNQVDSDAYPTPELKGHHKARTTISFATAPTSTVSTVWLYRSGFSPESEPPIRGEACRPKGEARRVGPKARRVESRLDFSEARRFGISQNRLASPRIAGIGKCTKLFFSETISHPRVIMKVKLVHAAFSKLKIDTDLPMQSTKRVLRYRHVHFYVTSWF